MTHQLPSIILDLRRRGVKMVFIPFFFTDKPYSFTCEQEDEEYVVGIMNDTEISYAMWRAFR